MDEVYRDEFTARVTTKALVGMRAPDEHFPVQHVALVLEYPDNMLMAWEGYPEAARRLAAALMNQADEAEGIT